MTSAADEVGGRTDWATLNIDILGLHEYSNPYRLFEFFFYSIALFKQNRKYVIHCQNFRQINSSIIASFACITNFVFHTSLLAKPLTQLVFEITTHGPPHKPHFERPECIKNRLIPAKQRMSLRVKLPLRYLLYLTTSHLLGFIGSAQVFRPIMFGSTSGVPLRLDPVHRYTPACSDVVYWVAGHSVVCL